MERQARWVLVLAAFAASVGVVSVANQGSPSMVQTLLDSLVYLVLIWLLAAVALLVLMRREA
ncbi:MAG TPA: hypothetical protein VIA02_02650 [Candidatus Limnocylindria bacterium]|jgi:hypothetical protein